MEQSIQDMIQALDVVTVQSAHLPSSPAIPVTCSDPTGRWGRPRIEIDCDFLSFVLELRGPTGLASVAGVSSCTIRRRALDYDFVEPAAPVYTETVDRTVGEVVRIYNSSASGPVSDISDAELDQLMHHILKIFPNFGRCMITGHVRQLGLWMPVSDLRQSYERVHGPPISYSNTATGRHPYHIVGPNILPSCFVPQIGGWACDLATRATATI
jgi:hypothetical protein